ncbi:DUF4817 domain-containing protein [Trichonephila clavipes]|nr:DUF4817 domain-containing protein [Trichonephila clavipes]
MSIHHPKRKKISDRNRIRPLTMCELLDCGIDFKTEFVPVRLYEGFCTRTPILGADIVGLFQTKMSKVLPKNSRRNSLCVEGSSTHRNFSRRGSWVDSPPFSYHSTIRRLACGYGSRVDKVSDRGLPCRKFEASTTKDPPCRSAMKVKSVENSNILPLINTELVDHFRDRKKYGPGWHPIHLPPADEITSTSPYSLVAKQSPESKSPHYALTGGAKKSTSSETAHRGPRSTVSILVFMRMGIKGHEQIFRSGGQSDAKPLVFSSQFNSDRYRARITNFFIPELNNHDVQELWFQQDGATCHTARATIDLLKDTFDNRLISRFGPVNWPPRSCDLTPLDYFLWGYVKSLVYADKPQTLDHLEDNIRRVIADIRPQMLEKVIENWTSRLDYIRASRDSPMPEIIFKM